jgi:mxaL protein
MLNNLDPTKVALILAGTLTLAACFPLTRSTPREIFEWNAVVDITRSMNVDDYRLDGKPVSRLEFVKASLRKSLTELPCGSRLGLGVFTERQAAILLRPIEVCSGYAALDAAVAQLDWRMAWAADSRIAEGLRNSLELLQGEDAALAFFSDGQEAPPVNPRYRADLGALKGKARGLVVGVGGLSPSPIPKFGEDGKRLGVYAMDEVLQRSTFGLSELPPEQVEGYHARNAPFGKAPEGGSEHLSALREDYLRQLAEQAGLGYHRLESAEALITRLQQPGSGHQAATETDIRPLPAALAWLLVVVAYASRLPPLRGFFRQFSAKVDPVWEGASARDRR